MTAFVCVCACIRKCIYVRLVEVDVGTLQAPKKKLSNKEKKQRAKVRKAQRERGEDVSDTDEDEL